MKTMTKAASSVKITVALHFSWLYVVSFLDLLATSLIVPLLSTHLRALGMSHTLTGLISSVYPSVQLLSGPSIGCWSDCYGRRQMLLFSLFVCASCYYCLGLSTSVTVVFALRCIIGVFKHTQMLCKAMVTDIIPLCTNQSNVYGILNSTTAMGYMLGPMIAGHIFELKHGFLYLTRLTCVIFILNILLVYCFLPDDNDANNNSDNNRIMNHKYNKNTYIVNSTVLKIFSYFMTIHWVHFWDIFLLKFLLSASISVFYMVYPLMIEEEFKMSIKFIGYASSFQGLVSIVCSLFIEQMWPLYLLNKSYYCKLVYSLCILLLSFMCIVLITPNFLTFIAVLIPLCYSSSLLRIVTTKKLLEKSSLHQKGSFIGAESTVTAMAHLIGLLMFGFWRDKFGGPVCAPLILSVILTGLGAVLSAVLYSIYTGK